MHPMRIYKELGDFLDRAGLAYPTAHREVGRLVDAGILTERNVGRAACGSSPQGAIAIEWP